MSSPLAIGAVSAVLRNLLDDGLVEVAATLGSVKVTAVAPDTIRLDDPDAPPSQLNLFLHRVAPNPALRNAALPAYDGNGGRVSNPPLALNLHYLLTAYGHADFQAEILLGYGMHLLHERPVLDRASIRTALSPGPLDTSILPPAFQALSAADLADQLEAVTVTLEPIDGEEMSRLWAASQSHYRPSAAYVVSVVLIEARKPKRSALPVLTRDLVVTPGLVAPFPTIESVEPVSAQVGETVRLAGHHLDGAAAKVRFAHRLLDTPNVVTVGASPDPAGIDVAVPTGPAGVYTVSAALVRPGETAARETNVAALLLAPEPQLPPTTITRDATTRRVSVTLGVSPDVHAAQEAQLTLGGVSADAAPRTTTVSSLTFNLPPVPPGPQWARLTVDGVESRLVDRTVEPPAFDPAQSVTVPA